MLLMTRHGVADPAAFLESATAALELLAGRPGFRTGSVTQAIDEPGLMMIVMEWADVGSYRRAFSDFAVRMAAVPLLSSALDEPSAFQVAVEVTPSGVVTHETDVTPADQASRRLRGRE